MKTKKVKFICKSEIKDEKAVFDKIEKSIITLFFLNNENIHSDDFINHYKFCAEMKVFVIFINVNADLHDMHSKLTEFNQLNTFDGNFLNQEHLYHQFMLLVYKMLKRENELKFKINSECFKKANLDVKIEKRNFEETSSVEIPENNHLIFMNLNRRIYYIFEKNTFNFIKKMRLLASDSFLIGLSTISFIKCLNQFCLISRCKIYLMSRDYEKIILIKELNQYLSYLCHDEKSEKTYIYSYQNEIIAFKGKAIKAPTKCTI